MVTSRNHLHASAFGTGLAEGDPDGDAFLRVDSGVGRILMPTDKGRCLGFLDEKDGSGEQDIRPQQIFHHIQNHRVVGNFIEKFEDVVGVVTVFRMNFPGMFPLCLFQQTAVPSCLYPVKSIYGKQKTVVPELLNLGWSQLFGHLEMFIDSDSFPISARRFL